MTNSIQIFQFNAYALRMIADDEGEPWFIAKDIAEILDYKDTEAMTRRLDDDEVQNLQIVGFGNRGVNLINESGLYSVILRSQKEEAKTFKRWVTHEVLPSIRKNGYYRDDSSLPDGDFQEMPFQRMDPARLKQLRLTSKGLAQAYLIECGITPDYVNQALSLLNNDKLLPDSDNTATLFYDEWVSDQLDGIPVSPANSMDVYKLYQNWCYETADDPLAINVFVASLKRRGARSKAKHYFNANGHVIVRRCIFPMGYFTKPDEIAAQKWIGDCVLAFQAAMDCYIKNSE